MMFPPDDQPDDLLWWEMIADYPELTDDLEDFGNDPEAGVVAAVGIFAMLKLRFWRHVNDVLPVDSREGHRSDNAPPPQAGGSIF